MKVPEGQTHQSLLIDADIWKLWRREAAKRNVSGVGLLRCVMRILTQDPALLANVIDDDGMLSERPYSALSSNYLAAVAKLGGEAFNGEVVKVLDTDFGSGKKAAIALTEAGYLVMEKRDTGEYPARWHVTLTDAGRDAL